MIRFLLPFGLLLAATAGPAQAFVQGDPLLDGMVASARARIGTTFEGGSTLIDAHAEGRTLVLGVRVQPEARTMFTTEELGQLIGYGMCQSGGEGFFSEGRTLRVEISGGGAAASTAMDACPTVTMSELLTRAAARAIEQQLGGRRRDPVQITSAHAEGNELVVIFDGFAGWRRRYTDDQINRLFFGGYCGRANANRFLDGTRTIRVDTLENGRNPRRGVPVSSCDGFRSR